MTKKAAAGATVGAGISVVLGCILSIVRFTTGGIAAGSFAAMIQSFIGNVAAGSFFSILQSIGALGTFTTFSCLGVFAAVGAAFGALMPTKKKWSEIESYICYIIYIYLPKFSLKITISLLNL